MPPDDQAHSGSIGDSIEWKVLSELKRNSFRFTVDQREKVTTSNSQKMIRLRGAICKVDLLIRQIFTFLQPEWLLDLELETKDIESETSSEPEMVFDENNENDDSSSQSSVETSSVSPLEKQLESLSRSFSPSANETRSHLRRLCSLLEARVNHLLVPFERGDRVHSGGYPRLVRLMNHLCILRSDTGLKPIPNALYGRTLDFLFNIAADTNTEVADAFIKLISLRQYRPNTKVLRRMLESANNLCRCLCSFFKFVCRVRSSAASLDDIITQSNASSASIQSFPRFGLLQKFRQKTKVAYHAILSHVDHCTKKKSTEHRILLQLPGSSDISICSSRNVTEMEDLPIQLFFTTCPLDNWQLARMSFLPPEHGGTYQSRKLYGALSYSYNSDTDLVFYVPVDYKRPDHGEIPVHVPSRLNIPRKYGNSVPNHQHSLWTLIKQGRFATQLPVDYFDRSGDTNIFGIDQRKALAINLVLGLMLSMDSDHDLESWNPKHIHFLDPIDAICTPFVSIRTKLERENRRKQLSATRLSNCYCVDGDVVDQKPLPEFMRLAKALLQLAYGERLYSIELPKRSQQDFIEIWKKFRRTVNFFLENPTSRPGVNLETLPFLQAAWGCLDFHKEYQARILRAAPGQRIDIAWEVVFDTILVKIDGNLASKMLSKSIAKTLRTEEPLFSASSAPRQATVNYSNTSIQSSPWADVMEKAAKKDLLAYYDALIAQWGQPGVELFDTKQAAKPSTAHDFWQCLDIFHKSYLDAVSQRNIKSGAESPRRIRIAVLDTGIDFNSPDIWAAKKDGRMKYEWCHSWVGDESDTTDEDDELHGTNCAHLLHKVAPEADIYVGKVFKGHSLRFCEAENIARAIEYAVYEWKVDIISMSFGLSGPTARKDGEKDEESQVLEKYKQIVDDIENVIRKAAPSSHIFFAAASNYGKNKPRAFPANYHPWVICVHASEGNGEDGGINPELENEFNFMTLGMGIDLKEREWLGKGGKLIPIYKTVKKSGTSFATPIAAGIAATVLDLTARVEAVDEQAKEKIKRHDEMEKILRIMSTAKGKDDARGRLHYMAPWLHWKDGWERNDSVSRGVWDTINNRLNCRY